MYYSFLSIKPTNSAYGPVFILGQPENTILKNKIILKSFLLFFLVCLSFLVLICRPILAAEGNEDKEGIVENNYGPNLTKPTRALAICLNDTPLLTANEQALSNDYRNQLDMATVLCFQAGYENPDHAEVWKRLGLLTETKSFFVTDPKERSDLMAEATAHFGHSARLEFEHSKQEVLDSEGPDPPLPLADPYLTELIWLGRLRRGEMTMAEIYKRYTAENLDPLHRPEFWQERALFIQSIQDPAQREAELTAAREEFLKLWLSMPVEVPWRGLTDKFGPQKFKKVEVLFAWAAGLTDIANNEGDPELNQTLFLEAIDLYKLALKLPLDLFELKALVSQLDQTDLEAPDNDTILALWTIKDVVYDHICKKFPEDISLWASWGRDYYSRSSRQPDYRIWLSYFKTAGEKYQKYVDKSLKPAEALHEWGSQLEFNTYPILAYLNLEDSDDRVLRIVTVLDLSLDKYRKAMDLAPDLLTNIKSLSRILLKLSIFKPENEFETFLDESNSLAYLAISRDPNTAGAWLQRGLDYLDFLKLGKPGFEAKSRLTVEAFAAFRQYLLSNVGQIEDLRQMADQVWQASENIPGLRLQGLQLLVDICQKLILLDPKDPDYRFALGLSLYCFLDASPYWPDDLIFSNSLPTREAFEQALVNFETGLELLSDLERAAPSSVALGLETETNILPRPWGWLPPTISEFLSQEPGPGVNLVSAGFQERFSSSVKSELGRLVSAASPELLPPWYQFRLASLFRRVAASGYPTPIDQMAFFRLADLYLNSALTSLSSNQDHLTTLNNNTSSSYQRHKSQTLRSLILSEKGLLLSEMSFLVEKDADFLLQTAKQIWAQAEKDSPGSSRYALARWAAWTKKQEDLIPLLNHTAEEQTNLLWPSFSEARLDPAFKGLIDHHWFKSAWFGYSR
jgi:hypothetical protein